jgi:hypothetical protein
MAVVSLNCKTVYPSRVYPAPPVQTIKAVDGVVDVTGITRRGRQEKVSASPHTRGAYTVN